MNYIKCFLIKLIKSNGVSKVYKEIYIPPDGKHKGFVRRYLVNPDRAKSGSKISRLYKLYLSFVKMLEDHGIPEESKSSHDNLLKYKTKLIRSVMLAKAKPIPPALFVLSDHMERRLQESEIITTHRFVEGQTQRVTTRTLDCPEEVDPDPETVKFIDENLVNPLKALSGKVKDCHGRNLKITSASPRHVYQRAEFRISQYVEQYITEKHYHDLREVLGYDIRDANAPDSAKKEFEKFRDVFEQHIRDDIAANADNMAKELCQNLVNTVKNPLWVKEGNNDRAFGDSSKEGTTEFHSKDFTVVVAHSGTIMTFWPNSAGERFAIEQGWKGARKSGNQWVSSGQKWFEFVKDFDRRNFARGYYLQADVRRKIFNAIRFSNQKIYYRDTHSIKYSQYSQYSVRQLLDIAKHNNVNVPDKSEGVSPLKYANQVIEALISSTDRDVCLDMEGKYIIDSDIMQYDSRVFTDYDFLPSDAHRRYSPPQNSRNSKRNAGSTQRDSSIGEKGVSTLLEFRNTLAH